MADVFLGSVYAKLELKTGDLSSAVNSAENSLRNLGNSMSKATDGGTASTTKLSQAWVAVSSVVSNIATRAFNSLTSSIDGGIKRFDTMNNFPKVMKNVGVSTEQSAAIINDLSEKLKGLPTALDDGAAAVQRFTMTTHDVQKSEDWFLALNDAILSGGASMDLQSTALEQFTQMLAVGKPDMMAWRSVIRAMPAQMDMLAKSMGYVSGEAGGDLYDAFLKGKVSADDLMEAMVKLDKEGGDGIRAFKDTAFDATGGISTQLANLKNAMNRFWQSIFSAMGQDNIRNILSGLYDGIGKLATILSNLVKNVAPAFSKLAMSLGGVGNKLLDVLNAILNNGATVAIINGIANGLAFLADIIAKIPTEVLTGILGAFIGMKVLAPVIPILGGIGSALGGFGSKILSFINPFKSLTSVVKTGGSAIVNGVSKIGNGLGKMIGSIFEPLGNAKVLMGAASVAIIAAGLVLFAKAFNDMSSANIDLGKIALLTLATAATVALFALVGTIGVYAAIGGIATAIIGGGLAAITASFVYVSENVDKINLGAIKQLSIIVAEVSVILGLISGFAVFGTVAGIASGIIGGGLAVAAMGLAKASEYANLIDMQGIIELSAILAEVGVILGLISGFAVFGAVSSVANMIISGGLLVSALALREVSKIVPEIDMKAIEKFSVLVAEVDVILSVISGFAALGAIGAIATDVVSGGLLVAAIALRETSNKAKEIDEGQIGKLEGVVAQASAVLSGISLLAPFASIGALVTNVIAGGLAVAARELFNASRYAMMLSENAFNAMENILQKLAGWQTGNLFKNLENMINTGILTKVAENVGSVARSLNKLEPVKNEVIDSLKENITNLSTLETSGVLKSIGDMWASGNLAEVASNIRNIVNELSGLTPPNNDTIDALKTAITNLSKIEIQGNGLFQNRGKDAEDLAFVVWKIRDIANNLNGCPRIDEGICTNFVNSMNKFKDISDETRNGINRLKYLGDGLNNIDWIKHILGDIPEGLAVKTSGFVSAIQKFGDITDKHREGALRLRNMGDSLGNINWIKYILGDIPTDLATKAQILVDAVQKLAGITIDNGKINQAIQGITQLANGMKNQLMGTVNNMNVAGSDFVTKFIEGVTSRHGDVEQQGKTMGEKLVNGLKSIGESLRSAGQFAQGQYWQAIEGKMQDEYWQGQTMAKKFRQGLYDLDYGNAGWWAVQGFINGANSQNVYSVGWKVASRFLKGLKDRGQQGSPWKTTISIGKFAGEGFAEGIKKSDGMVDKAASQLADIAMSALNLDEYGKIMVSPDMSSLNNQIATMNATVKSGEVDRPNETNIYGNINITQAHEDENVLDTLARATSLNEKGMAVAV